MIKYYETKNDIEFPEIQGYKRQFSINLPQGEEKEESKEPQIIYIQQQAPEQQTEKKEVQETPVVKTEERSKIKPNRTNWSDIRSIIVGNEGFMSTAKNLFNEPSASIGYGFFGKLPDGRKVFPGMTITRSEADKQLDIAINKLSNYIQGSLNKYNLQTSPEQLNVLIDLGYHAGPGTVDKLLKESNGNSDEIGSLLLRYATRAKYGDTNINGALEGRALRRAQAWNKYTLKGKMGLKLPKFQNPADTIPVPKVSDSLINGSKTFTEMCAEFQNKVLRNSGYKTSSDAWKLENADMYMSGYTNLEKPTVYNKYKVQKYNKAAANNLKQNLDPNMLDPNQIYIANMYYTGSPFQEQAYKEGRDSITGTHTGYVKFNPDTSTWEVTHNIHGTVHVDPLNNILGSQGKYGVTALLKPQKRTFKDRVIDTARLIGKKVYTSGPSTLKRRGGVLFKQDGGGLYGEIEPSVITAISENKTNNPYGIQYIRELNNFRNQAMNDFGLTDKEYADIASFAVNTANMETKLGDSPRYKIKSAIPDSILSLAKRISGKDNLDLSKGLTQIKYNTDLQVHPELEELYNKYKITNLEDPKQSAKATVLRTLYGLNQTTGDYHYSDGTKIPDDTKLAMWWNRGKLTDRINTNPTDESVGGATGYARRFEHQKLIN